MQGTWSFKAMFSLSNTFDGRSIQKRDERNQIIKRIPAILISLRALALTFR